MSSSKRLLLLYAGDTYKLSSLIIRRVLLTKPTTVQAFREKTRQLLLDHGAAQSSSSQSQKNITAIKLLEWDREWNLMQYYGLQEYARRWWVSSKKSSWSFSSIAGSSINTSGAADIQHQHRTITSSKQQQNVARVAFMITSEQRYKLSTNLGYTKSEIKSFKPIQALLLLEHNVQRNGGDFRIKLKELMEENDRAMASNMQHQHGDQSNKQTADEKEVVAPQQQNSVLPEETQRMRVKADVASALLLSSSSSSSRDGSDNKRVDDEVVAKSREKEDIWIESNDIVVVANDTLVAENYIPEAVNDTPYPSSQLSSPPLKPVNLMNVTSNKSEELHMKPDVAAVILTSQQQQEQNLNNSEQQEQQIMIDEQEGHLSSEEVIEEEGTCWYEVVKKPSSTKEIEEHVIALFPTKKEALECVRIKHKFRRKDTAAVEDEQEEEEAVKFLVRRRWNA